MPCHSQYLSAARAVRSHQIHPKARLPEPPSRAELIRHA